MFFTSRGIHSFTLEAPDVSDTLHHTSDMIHMLPTHFTAHVMWLHSCALRRRVLIWWYHPQVVQVYTALAGGGVGVFVGLLTMGIDALAKAGTVK